MDRRERIGDPEESLRIALEGQQGQIWTALPGIVQGFDPAKMTVSVQPTVTGTARNPDGSTREIQMPVLLDCPVLWQGGGGVSLTFPVQAGDECLVVFASRCIDAWWQLGGVRGQAEFRMHDLSDGFALVGVRSLPRAYAVSTTAAQLRSDDGSAVIEVNPTSHAINITSTAPVNVTSSQSANVTAPAINLGATGQTLLAFITSSFQALFNGHTHNDPQGGATSGPNQTMTASHMTTTVKGG